MTGPVDDLMDGVVDELVERRVPWTAPLIRSWYAEETLRANLREPMSTEAGRLRNADFGRQFRTALGIGGPEDPLAWANRRLDLPDGGWALVGIRFRGRDTRLPFVDVVATTAPPTPDGLAGLAETVVPAYREFSPLCLRTDAPDGPGLVEDLRGDPRFAAGSGVDMHVVAGRVSELRNRPRSAAYPRVRLRAGDAGPLARRVAEIYRDLSATQPELATWANPEDLESLTACADEGLLFEVLADETPAGVVAALRTDDHGMTGFSVQEICLDPEHRGRRLGPAVAQRLADELPARPADVLWGTIHAANAPSLRNALSIGRSLVGGYVWVTPAGLPGMPATVTG
jgi:L-amino acid N-acyltransferase YncA